MNNKVYIYTLSDPRNNLIRYVGKTKNLNKRYSEHLNKFKKNHKSNWIKHLKVAGFNPVMEVIDEVFESEWEYWEQHWIGQLKNWGFNLVNSTKGGEGGITWIGLHHNSKKVNQFDLNGNFIKSWNCISDAEKTLSINRKISECCLGFRKSAGSFLWSFSDKINVYYKKTTAKKVIKFDLNFKEIEKFDSARKAAKELGVSDRTITECCRGEIKTVKKFIYKYEI